MDVSELFDNIMGALWDTNVSLHDDARNAVAMAKLLRAQRGAPMFGHDRPAHNWIFSDGSYAIVADDGSAVYDFGH